MQLRELLANLFHVFERVVFEHRHELLDRNRHMVQSSLKAGDAVRVLFQLGIVDAGGGGDVEVVYGAGEHEILKIQVVEVPAVRAAVPCVCGIARQVVRPRPDAVLSRLVLGGVVIAHCGAAHRTTCQFLEEIRELLALAAALSFLSKESHILNAVEQRRVDDFGVVPRNYFLSHAAFLGLKFGDIFADNSTIAQEFVHITLMPHGFASIPSRDVFFNEGAGDDATPVATHVHVEDATDELCAIFEHMDFAVAHFKPARDLTRHDDALLGLLALRLPVRKRPERLVFALAVRTHHVRQNGEEGSVRGEVQDDVLCRKADSDAVLRDVEQQQQRFVHPISGQTVQGFGDEHRARRDFAALASLEEATEFACQGVVAAKSGDADVLQGFGDRQAMGFDESHGGVVLPAFTVAPGLALR